MRKNQFGVFKIITFLMVMILYFLMTYGMMWRLHLLWRLPIEIRCKAMTVICILYCAVFFFCLQFTEGMSIGKRRMLDLIFGYFSSSLCVNVVSAVLCSIFVSYGRGRILVLGVLLVFLQTVIGMIWILACHRQYEKVQFRKEAIFIYGSREDAGEYIRVNNTINQYFKISKSLDYKEGLDRILDEIRESSVVFLGDIPVDIRNIILKFCMAGKIECCSIPKISDIYIQNAKILQLNDKLLLQYPPLSLDTGRAAAKRCMDVVVALLMMVCFSPIMLIIAIAIKLEDGGPVIYTQDRVTLNGRPFLMYKFRSMYVDAEKDGARLAKKNDDRITRVGRVIRNLHFDELPQLVNVLRGEMSLVGPRPERQEFIDEYSRHIPEFPERLKVKSGLTGYAQVYGRYNSEPEDKIKYDLYYIYNYSFWLDLKLLILTVRILFQKENTEGVDADQVNALRQSRGRDGGASH